MNQNHNIPTNVPNYSLFSKVIILLGFMILLYFLASFLGLIMGFPFVIAELGLTKNWEPEQISNLQNGLNAMVNSPKGTNSWYFLMIIQGISHLGGFWVAGLAYLKFIEKKTFEDLNKTNFNWGFLRYGFLITLIALPLIEITIRWNQNIQLPAGLHKTFKEMEDQTGKLTDFLIGFDQAHQYVIALIVVAVFAAVGEELIFRGLLQNFILKATKNHHIAIWVAAIVFSAIHFQFFGFIPRMLLGALFGYMYVWTGNIWVPIIGHFVNNGLSVTAAYYVKTSGTNLNLEKMNSPIYVTLIAAFLFVFLMKNFYDNRLMGSQDESAI